MPSERPLLKDFIGLNGHTVQFRPELYRPIATLVRDYHPAEWDLGKDSYFVPPFPFAEIGWIGAGFMVRGGSKDGAPTLCLCSRRYHAITGRVGGGIRDSMRSVSLEPFGPRGTNARVETVEIGNEPGKFSDADYRIIFENMARGFKAGDPPAPGGQLRANDKQEPRICQVRELYRRPGELV